SFRFLNREKTFPSPVAIDWNFADYGKLWTYNLNYFEFLATKSKTEGLALIRSWIQAEATHADGWEPYPISLRLVRWIRFLKQHFPSALPEDVVASIKNQYEALWKKLEYHLGGNHLLENAIALCLTAHFLQDEVRAPRAQRLLHAELGKQYLSDGAHYELSGMYHAVLLDRLLTLWEHLTTVPSPSFANLDPILKNSIQKQLNWLLAFATEDGQYAHFNDSTEGIAPSVEQLSQRSEALGLEVIPGQLTTSGYRRWSHLLYDLWMDAAAIGPSYIPGHAHADNLTFVLHVTGHPVIVDPAISTYEKNERRSWERSTAAHNTVTVADRNSSDVWGGFRVGKRAHTRILSDKQDQLKATYSGSAYAHQRTFRRAIDKIMIQDKVTPPQKAVARFHFDYRQEVLLTDDALRCGTLSLKWSSAKAQLVDYEQAVGWNDCRPARCLELTFVGKLDVSLSFS
ncbi:MAG: alginate lyase family protein, partial [Bacteroidota bacterium]